MSGVSKSQVSRLCGEIDERVTALLTRPIEGDWPVPAGSTPPTSQVPRGRADRQHRDARHRYGELGTACLAKNERRSTPSIAQEVLSQIAQLPASTILNRLLELVGDEVRDPDFRRAFSGRNLNNTDSSSTLIKTPTLTTADSPSFSPFSVTYPSPCSSCSSSEP
jgi:hypothetical protein